MKESPLKPTNKHILTINGGSSSIKFALYATVKPLKRGLSGTVDRIGLSGTNLKFNEADGKPEVSRKLVASNHKSAANALIDWLEKQIDFKSVTGVGHRVVHGMKHTEPEIVTKKLLAELRRISPNDPDHLPREIELIEVLRQRHPKLRQVACFDTAFHQTMPRVAKLLPIPRRFDAKGIQRYGFHGLSYEYIARALRQQAPGLAAGRVVVAHLGNGASLCGMRDGCSQETTMGFTALDGLVMGTRCGTLDAGVVLYMLQQKGLTAHAVEQVLYERSGLLGVSGLSSDMRTLLASSDPRAHEAVELFAFRVAQQTAVMAASLGGLDGFVFTGGIGEHAAGVRAMVGERLRWLGVELDAAVNKGGPGRISTQHSRVEVHVITTDEEAMIAQHTNDML